jgi:hypothetical protein
MQRLRCISKAVRVSCCEFVFIGSAMIRQTELRKCVVVVDAFMYSNQTCFVCVSGRICMPKRNR